MIEYLNGILLALDEDRAVVEVGGVGYGVQIAATAAQSMGDPGSRVTLWILTYVREDTLRLYGFPTRYERDVFEVFLGMPGVGPSVGLAILSTLSIAEIIQAAKLGDAARFKKVKGVGPKLAEKLLLEIKGRIDRLTRGLPPEALSETADIESAPQGEAARDAASALEALGVGPAQAARAVGKAVEALGEDASVEALVREGLKHRRG